MTPKLEKLFRRLETKRGSDRRTSAHVELPAKPIVYLLDRPGAQQSDIIVAERGAPQEQPRRDRHRNHERSCRWRFRARINMNLREDKHWSYGAFSFFIDAKGQEPFLTLAPVQTDKTKESMAEVNKELHEFAKAKPVTDAELQADVSNRVLSLPGSRESLRSLAATVGEMVTFGYPDDYYDTYAGKVKALRVADINDAANTVLHPDKLVWIVVGDRSKIESGVRELNIGDVRVIDADGNPAK